MEFPSQSIWIIWACFVLGRMFDTNWGKVEEAGVELSGEKK